MENKAVWSSGCALWLWFTWWFCAAPPFFPDDVDWTQYISAADYIWHYDGVVQYPTWRKPLYPYLLGLTSFDGYLSSARIWNGVGMLAAMLGFAWFAKCHSSPRSFVILSILWMIHPLIQDARFWINPYPLWGGVLILMFSVWYSLNKVSSDKTWLLLSVLMALTVALDGRSWIAIVPLFVSLFWMFKSRRRLLIVLGVLVFGTTIEWSINHLYNLEVQSIVDSLISQRTYLFREDMIHQLFPPFEGSQAIAETCKHSSAELRLMDWNCSMALFVGNIQAWIAWGLIPPLGMLILLLAGLFGRVKDRFLICSVLMIMFQLCLSLVVWQPPRYLFLTLGIWLFLWVDWIELIAKKNPWYGWVVGAILIGWWSQSIQQLNSQDHPRDWDTTGRLVAEQVGESVLDCTGQAFFLAQLSSYRPNDWTLSPNESDCLSWMVDGKLRNWGVDTVLTSTQLATTNEWSLETGFDFEQGIVWMYTFDGFMEQE